MACVEQISMQVLPLGTQPEFKRVALPKFIYLLLETDLAIGNPASFNLHPEALVVHLYLEHVSSLSNSEY